MRTFLKTILCGLTVISLIQCSKHIELPPSDPNNGGLFLPDNFGAVVVTDSIGRTRHIAVNDNGDIYAQLNNSKDGKGTVVLRDINKDGKADSIVYFGDYIDKGRSATGVSIHQGYLYTSTKRMIYRNKLTAGEMVPTSETEVVLTDMEENIGKNPILRLSKERWPSIRPWCKTQDIDGDEDPDFLPDSMKCLWNARSQHTRSVAGELPGAEEHRLPLSGEDLRIGVEGGLKRVLQPGRVLQPSRAFQPIDRRHFYSVSFQ